MKIEQKIGGGVSGQMRLGEESHKGLLSLLDVLRIKKKGKESESYLHSHVTAEEKIPLRVRSLRLVHKEATEGESLKTGQASYVPGEAGAPQTPSPILADRPDSPFPSTFLFLCIDL